MDGAAVCLSSGDVLVCGVDEAAARARAALSFDATSPSDSSLFIFTVHNGRIRVVAPPFPLLDRSQLRSLWNVVPLVKRSVHSRKFMPKLLAQGVDNGMGDGVFSPTSRSTLLRYCATDAARHPALPRLSRPPRYHKPTVPKFEISVEETKWLAEGSSCGQQKVNVKGEIYLLVGAGENFLMGSSEKRNLKASLAQDVAFSLRFLRPVNDSRLSPHSFTRDMDQVRPMGTIFSIFPGHDKGGQEAYVSYHYHEVSSVAAAQQWPVRCCARWHLTSGVASSTNDLRRLTIMILTEQQKSAVLIEWVLRVQPTVPLQRILAVKASNGWCDAVQGSLRSDLRFRYDASSGSVGAILVEAALSPLEVAMLQQQRQVIRLEGKCRGLYGSATEITAMRRIRNVSLRSSFAYELRCAVRGEG